LSLNLTGGPHPSAFFSFFCVYFKIVFLCLCFLR
jgi:hypothetical protein